MSWFTIIKVDLSDPEITEQLYGLPLTVNLEAGEKPPTREEFMAEHQRLMERSQEAVRMNKNPLATAYQRIMELNMKRMENWQSINDKDKILEETT